MQYRVTVAPITLAPSFFPAPFEAPLEQPYAERPKVELEVEETETVKSVLARATRELGVEVAGLDESPADNLAFFALYDAADEAGFGAGRKFGHLYDLTTVDQSGRASWRRDYSEVAYGDFFRAAEAGAIEGDPRRVYLILNPLEGNGVVLTWALLFLAWKTLREIISLTSDVEGALALRERWDRRRERVRRAEEAVDEHYLGWAERGAVPPNFAHMLEAGDPWSSEDLGSLLGTSAAVAEAVLGGFGFAQDASGLWRMRGDDDGSFMRDAVEETFIAVDAGPVPELEVKRRLERYVATGERSRAPELVEGSFEEDFGAYDAALPAEDLETDDAPTPHSDASFHETTVECTCGELDCHARLRFSIHGEKLRLEPENVTDHLELSSGQVLELWDRVLEEIEEA